MGNHGNPMSNYTTNEIRGGMKLLIDGDPYSVIDNEYVKPGKGQAFNRIKVRNLRTGRTVEKSYRSGESIEAADVMDQEMQYLYKDGDFWAFMNPENFEQLSAGEAAVGDAAKWMKDGIICIITLWNGVPLLVTPPAHIDLKVIETPRRAARRWPSSKPGLRCACRCSSTKARSCASIPAPGNTSRAQRVSQA